VDPGSVSRQLEHQPLDIVPQLWRSLANCVDAPSETDGQLATRLATQAGHLLLELRAMLFAEGASTWDVKDAGDAVAQRFLAEQFATHRPDDAVLSEEGREDPRRFGADRVWIVDPLDGTREFSEPGRIDWAVHIALWAGDRFGAAAVSLPSLERTFTTDDPTPCPRLTASDRRRSRTRRAVDHRRPR